MIGGSIARRCTIAIVATGLWASCGTGAAFAQSKPKPRPAPPQPHSVQIGGYAMFGNINFTAADSFDAITGSPSGLMFGGGARIGLPIGGLFLDVGAWRYQADGERVFVADNDEVFKLGIPVTISVTPIELSAGWRLRIRSAPKLVPYAAGGFTLLQYRETSAFAEEDENVDETFNGYHVLGGVEYKLARWFGLAGEASWSTVPNAIGESGVSKAFDETDLGGTTFRVKITIGR